MTVMSVLSRSTRQGGPLSFRADIVSTGGEVPTDSEKAVAEAASSLTFEFTRFQLVRPGSPATTILARSAVK